MITEEVKKQTGIWLDYREAYLIPLFEETNGEPLVHHIRSEIDTGATKGGIAPKVPFGNQGGVSEREMLERRKHQEKAYFDAILKQIDPHTDELYIFGPAEAKIGLKKAMEQIKNFHPVIRDVHSADKLTHNQMIAEVRRFFDAAKN